MDKIASLYSQRGRQTSSPEITSEVPGFFKLPHLSSEKVSEGHNKELSGPVFPSTFFPTGTLLYRSAGSVLIKILFILCITRKEGKEIWYSGMSLHIPCKLKRN